MDVTHPVHQLMLGLVNDLRSKDSELAAEEGEGEDSIFLRRPFEDDENFAEYAGEVEHPMWIEVRE
jgi:hypothetical protein